MTQGVILAMAIDRCFADDVSVLSADLAALSAVSEAVSAWVDAAIDDIGPEPEPEPIVKPSLPKPKRPSMT